MKIKEFKKAPKWLLEAKVENKDVKIFKEDAYVVTTLEPGRFIKELTWGEDV